MENKILKKQELITKEVDFYGDTIMCAEDKSTGKIYVGIKWVCEGIGLTSDQIKNERKKIGKDLVLSKGGQNYPSLQTVENKRFYALKLIISHFGLQRLLLLLRCKKKTLLLLQS